MLWWRISADHESSNLRYDFGMVKHESPGAVNVPELVKKMISSAMQEERQLTLLRQALIDDDNDAVREIAWALVEIGSERQELQAEAR